MSEYMARPRWLAARKSSRSLPTIAGCGGDGVQRPLQAGPHRPLPRAAAAAQDGVGAVGLVGQAQQVGPFGVVELQGAGERVEHAGRDPGQGAAFELGVVLHAHPGQRGDLTAPQPRHPTPPGDGQPGLLGADLGAAGGEELAHFDSVVHAGDGTTRRPAVGMHWQYTHHQ